MTRVDALVVGGGPAGSTAAILLARTGWRVAVVEKASFPRRKVCGEYVSATTWPVLRALGVADALGVRAGPPVTRVGFASGTERVESSMPAGAPGATGRAVGREVLDTALWNEAIRAGAQPWQPWRVVAVRRGAIEHAAELREAHGEREASLHARIVIDAHGSWGRSPFEGDARKPAARPGDLLGFKARFAAARLPAGLMPLVIFPGGYGGLVHAEGGEVSFSCCIRRDVLRGLRAQGGPREAGAAVLAHVMRHCDAAHDALERAELAAPWLSAGPIRPGIRALAHDRVFAVGNAAGEAHPLVAEGISMAIQSAWILGGLLAASDPAALRCEEIGHEYAARWKEHLAPRVRAAALFAALMARPAGARASALAVARFPRLLTWGARWSGKARMLRAATEAA